jgi:hypothetical protein
MEKTEAYITTKGEKWLTQQIEPFKKTIAKQGYGSLKITSQETLEKALNARTNLGGILKQITEARKSITDPMNVALKNARLIFAPLEDEILSQDKHLSGEIIKWRMAKEAEQQKKMAEIETKVKAGEITFEKAAAQVERQSEKTKIIPQRVVTKARVTDLKQIPQQYITVNLWAIEKDLRAGIVVPGAELYQEKILTRK